MFLRIKLLPMGAHISLITILYLIVYLHDTLRAQLKILRLTLHPILYFIISLIYKKTLQAIKFAAAELWNKLPMTLKQLTNVTTFKSQLKGWLTKDYISSRETVKTDIPLLHTDDDTYELS